jgi:broad specificity phosphatase PhoE
MQGHTDVPLTAEGRRQAQQIGARLRAVPHPPQAVWSSDLARASETAAAIAAALDLPVIITPLLRETMLGDWEGLTRADIEARGDAELLANYLRDSHLYRPPNSETLEAMWERLHQAAADIRAEHPVGQVAVVGHGGSLRALLCSALDAPIPSMRRLWLDNASLSIIEELRGAQDGIQRVILINDTGHINPTGHLNNET